MEKAKMRLASHRPLAVVSTLRLLAASMMRMLPDYWGQVEFEDCAEAEQSSQCCQGLHTLHGRWPALIASSRVLKVCRFEAEIFCAHLQSGRWNGSRVLEAT